MTKPEPNWDRPQPLIPTNSKDDRPMLVVLAILAFLATLTLLSVKSSYSMAADWRSEIQNTITVQIKPVTGVERNVTAKKAQGEIEKNEKIAEVGILSDEYSRKLLEPWLGNTPLPDGVDLPILLSVQVEPGETLDAAQLATSLERENIDAVVDTHQDWTEQFKRSIFALQSMSILALILVFLAIFAAIIFATRSVLNGRRMLIDVLHQIGAAPNYTARLFSERFAWTGLKAGAIGAIGALFVLALAGLLTAGTAGSLQFLPKVTSGPTNLFLAALVPVSTLR